MRATIASATPGTLLALALLLAAGPARAQRADTASVLIRGGTLWTDGRGTVPGAAVLVRGGRIERAGAGVEAAGIRVLEVPTGGYILPGLVEAHTQTGLHGDAVGWDTDEDTRPITAELHALDAFYPFAAEVERARMGGITTMLIAPGGKNLIGGTGAVVKTAGSTRAAWVLRQPAVLKLSLGEEPKRAAAPPRTRMGELALLREHFRLAREYEAKRRDAAQKKQPFEEDPGLAASAAALRGEIPAVFQAYESIDITNALRLSDEWGLKPVIAYAAEGAEVAGELARRNAAVIVTSMKGLWYRLEKESFDTRNAARLLRAGVRLALQQGEGSPYGNGELLFNAAYLVRNGVSEEDALRAVTSWPAAILGVGDRVGRLEPGLDGDVVVLSGPPFDVHSRVLAVFVNGVQVYTREEATP